MKNKDKKYKLISDKESYQEQMLNLELNPKLDEIRAYAKEHDVPIIQDEGLAFLLTILDLTGAKRVLEIGSAIGYSSSLMALNSPNLIVDTMEIDTNSYELAKKNIHDLGLDKQINIFNVDALEGFDLVKDNQYDLIFLDAAKGQYINFFQIYEPLLKKGGVILADNLYFHDLLFEDINSRNLFGLVKRVDRFNQFAINEKNYKKHIFKIGDGIGVFIKEE